MRKIDDMLRIGDRDEWRKFLADSTLQEATLANLKASVAGKGFEDMRALAFKRCEHLNGEHRHVNLWP